MYLSIGTLQTRITLATAYRIPSGLWVLGRVFIDSMANTRYHLGVPVEDLDQRVSMLQEFFLAVDHGLRLPIKRVSFIPWRWSDSHTRHEVDIDWYLLFVRSSGQGNGA